MIADREVVRTRCCQVEETEMLQYLERSMRTHVNSKPVQRSGLQLFEEILKNATSEGNTKNILKKVFQLVLDNLLVNISDPAICHKITLKFERYLTLTQEYAGSVQLSEDLLQELFLLYHQIIEVIEELKSVEDEEVHEAEVTLLTSSASIETDAVVTNRR
eukprot:gene39140-48341_t